jgi:enoyl-[acyl-carrier protein] reductase I
MAALLTNLLQRNNMGFLANKRILITGMISTRSIAYGVAQAMHREGAELAFTYQGERVRDRVEEMAKKFSSSMIYQCDVSSDDDIDRLFVDLGKSWDKFDGFVHAIAFAPREALDGEFLDGFSREAFRIAHDISAYSFPAMAKAALPMMEGRKASLLTLSYLGAVRTMPHYNVMGMAKASLEASVRYLAMQLGRQGIRVNGISAGPIKTVAASGIGDFNKLLSYNAMHAPLKRNITVDEVGNAAAFLCSDLASGITGEITYVDGGFNTTALGTTEA